MFSPSYTNSSPRVGTAPSSRREPSLPSPLPPASIPLPPPRSPTRGDLRLDVIPSPRSPLREARSLSPSLLDAPVRSSLPDAGGAVKSPPLEHRPTPERAVVPPLRAWTSAARSPPPVGPSVSRARMGPNVGVPPNAQTAPRPASAPTPRPSSVRAQREEARYAPVSRNSRRSQTSLRMESGALISESRVTSTPQSRNAGAVTDTLRLGILSDPSLNRRYSVYGVERWNRVLDEFERGINIPVSDTTPEYDLYVPLPNFKVFVPRSSGVPSAFSENIVSREDWIHLRKYLRHFCNMGAVSVSVVDVNPLDDFFLSLANELSLQAFGVAASAVYRIRPSGATIVTISLPEVE